MNSLHLVLGVAALAFPIVLVLVAYDLRWIYLSIRAGVTPPWGAFARLFAAACCHAGALVLAVFAPHWPESLTKFWLHMTFDPGLTFYTLGLWELYGRMSKQREAARASDSTSA